jgi:hypothetical protein
MRHRAARCFPFESKRTSDRFQPGYARASALQVAPSALALNTFAGRSVFAIRRSAGLLKAAMCGCAAPSPRCCQSSFSQLRKNLGRTGRGRKFWLLGERPAGQRFSDQPLAPDLARQGAEPRPNKIRGPLTQPNAPRISPWLTRAPGLGCRCSHGPVYSDNGDPAQ